MPKSIRKLRAASRAKSSSAASPAVKSPSSSLLRKKPLGKKARLHAKISGKLQVLDNSAKKRGVTGKVDGADKMLSELELSLSKQKNLDANEGSEERKIKAAANVPTFRSNKLKGVVAVRETNRLKMVMENSSFKANPLAVLKAHLQQSQRAREHTQKV